MERDLRKLSDHVHGLLIIGGGIYGATAAREATSRGLSTALIEKGDFGGATSMNSLKTVHGGLRYLQQLDFARMRESIGERSALLRIAPHLVAPLPFLLPTYGHGMKGKEMLRLGLLLNDAVGWDRNKGLDPTSHIPPGRMLSRQECLRAIPGLPPAGLTGGAMWHDCLMYSSERLLLSFLLSAWDDGAALANYVEAESFIIEKGTVRGVVARDLLTGEELDVRAKVTLNMSGPWIDKVLARAPGLPRKTRLFPSKAMNIVVRQIFRDAAIGLPSSHTYRVAGKEIRTGSRYLFTIPWRGHTLIGTTHLPCDGDPDAFDVSEDDIAQFLEEVTGAHPGLGLTMSDVLFAYGGILPMEEDSPARGTIELVRHYRIHDHGDDEGLEGLVSVLGVKYTTARDVAEKAVDHVFRKLGFSPPKSVSRQKPLHGGDIADFGRFLREARARKPEGMSEESFEHLLHCVGSRYPDVLDIVDDDDSYAAALTPAKPVVKAQVLQAVRNEMAVKLADVVMRRTELGSTGFPGEDALGACARLMSWELDWSEERAAREMDEVRSLFAKFRTPPSSQLRRASR
jgi:glycerol-3-phosphate dehydrogenase